MSTAEKVLEIYSENPDKVETVIVVMAELAEFLEQKSLGEVLTLLRSAAEYNDYQLQESERPEAGPLCLDYYEGD